MVLDKALVGLSKFKYFVAIMLLFLHEYMLGDIELFTIDRTSYFYAFFVLGRILYQHYECLYAWTIRNKYVLVVFLLIYCVAFSLAHTIFDWDAMPVIIEKYIIPLSACGFLWVLFILCEMHAKTSMNILHYFGKYSLQYYLNHMLVLLFAFYCGKIVYSFLNSYVLSLLSIFGLTVMLCFVMLKIEQRLPQKTKILFGL